MLLPGHGEGPNALASATVATFGAIAAGTLDDNLPHPWGIHPSTIAVVAGVFATIALDADGARREAHFIGVLTAGVAAGAVKRAGWGP